VWRLGGRKPDGIHGFWATRLTRVSTNTGIVADAVRHAISIVALDGKVQRPAPPVRELMWLGLDDVTLVGQALSH
jgi:hypothetical protein